MQIKANPNDNPAISVSSTTKTSADEKSGRKSRKNNRTSIFAGDLGLHEDAVTLRKQCAQRKALKIVKDAWKSDKKIDQNMSDINDKLTQLRDDRNAYTDIIADDDAKKEALQQMYGVKTGSQEQKDLELLEKKAELGILASDFLPRETREKLAAAMGVTLLTVEEEVRLKELEDLPLTEYQERCLEITDRQSNFKKEKKDTEDLINIYSTSLYDMKLERLKFHDMADARKEADEELSSVSREVVGILTKEAKDSIDKALEEKREEAKEKAEEKAAQEEKIDQRKKEQEELDLRIDDFHEKNEKQEETRKEAEERSREDADLLEGILNHKADSTDMASDAQAQIKNMLHKMKLLEEDLKGSTIDNQL